MKTILVIEDDQNIRTNIMKLLKLKGFQVLGAENGEIGVQMATQHVPDLIISDIMMPKFDGYAVLTAIRQNPETAAIPLIFLTAKTERSDVREGMTLGADDYLTKPFTSQELITAIESRLEKQALVTQPYLDELKRAAEALSRSAYCDLLTDLPNRIWLHHRLQSVLSQAKPRQQIIAVLCLNIDRFSEVNTTFGNAVGDAVLRAMAERLSQILGNQNLVARLSGDEFGVVLVDLEQIQDIVEWTQMILGRITDPYSVDGREVLIQVSIGISRHPKDGATPDELLTCASTATRWSRKQGGGSYQFYSPTMESVDAERRLLETHLTTALEKSEFELHYQPQVNLITGRVIGLEALIRWHHPEQGMLSPDKFILIAEETGLINPIGEWVLRTACSQAKRWQVPNPVTFRVSVNLSTRQLRQKDLVKNIAQILQQTELPANWLTIELTETSVMDDVEAAIKTLRALKELGIEISIDDFGTGYSSLNYLKHLPIDTLKIDRSFVSQLTNNSQDAAIATAIIAMAQSLKLKVIAEGVETEEQLAFLRQHGCYAMQGFLYSPAVPAAEIQALLAEDRRLGLITTRP